MLLEGKTAMVYGGSGAVGGAVAKAFAREGARVVLAARRHGPLEAIAAEITSAGGEAHATTVDATDLAAVEAHIGDVARRFGPVKIAFSAIDWGDSQGQPLVEMTVDRFLRPIQTALTSWHNVGRTAARHMRAHGGGVILGFTANAGREAYNNVGGFGVACAAVEHFLRQLAVENGQFGVRCCWVRSPGSPDSPGVREVWQMHADSRGLSFEEVHREFAKDTPLRRIASLNQVADAAVLLASDLASSMTATMANTTGGAQVD